MRSIWNIGELRLISKRIERVRLADITPMSFDETYLPLAIGKQIVRNDLRVKPIFSLLEEEYGIPWSKHNTS